MVDNSNTHTGNFNVTVQPQRQWLERLSVIKAEGLEMARRKKEQGHRRLVEILAPHQVQSGDTVPVSAVVITLDWQTATKLAMVEDARSMITNAYNLGSLDPALPAILTSVIDSKGLYEHSIGEFFQLYGQFEGKYKLKKGSDTKRWRT